MARITPANTPNTPNPSLDKSPHGPSRKAPGYIAAITQGILYSTMGIFAKLLYATGLTAQQAVVLRFVFTVGFLGALLLAWRKHRLFSRHATVYAQGGVFFLSAWTCLIAFEYMNAGLVTVIFYAFPVVVAVLNAVFFKERVTALIVITLLLSTLGIVLVSGLLEPSSAEVGPIGMAAAVASCFLFATYSVLIQKTSEKDGPFTSTFSMSTLGLAISLVVFAPQVPGAMQAMTPYTFALASGLAVLATILPVVLFMFAIERIGATRASILSLVETPASLFLAWLVLGETLTVWQGVGAALIMVSVFAVMRK